MNADCDPKDVRSRCAPQFPQLQELLRVAMVKRSLQDAARHA